MFHKILPGVFLAFMAFSAASSIAQQPPDVVHSDIYRNTASGTDALLNVIASGDACSGNGNTANGYRSLTSDTWGCDNTAFGDQSLYTTTIGGSNTAVGALTLYFNTGANNTAVGAYALEESTTAVGNAAFGSYALRENVDCSYCVAIGSQALQQNTHGQQNTATGNSAMYSNTTGNYNTGDGYQALYSTNGSNNVAVGYQSLFGNSGSNSTALGFQALLLDTTGNNNTAVGYKALYSNTAGSGNIALGLNAGYSAKGSNNIEIGAAGAATDNAVIRIGTQGTQKKTYLAGVRGVNVTGGVAVMVTATGQLGVVSSSRRYKEDIRSMGDTSDRLLKLRPVTFRYKQPDENGQRPEQYGLIAEEVAKVMPELVIYNEKGQPETVAYQTLTPLLLNELQREHTQFQTEVDALRAEVAELRRAIGKN